MKEKKLLIEKVFEQAEKELNNKAKSTVANYLSVVFEEKFGFAKNERTFVRYYDNLVEKNLDYTIDAITLDQLCIYIGYKSYADFFEKFKDEPTIKITVSTDENSATTFSDLSKIIINVTVKPIFAMSEFMTKQNGMGIIGVVFILGIVANNFGFFNKINQSETIIPHSIVGKTQQKWMYWTGTEYQFENFDDEKKERYLINFDAIKLKKFKKIMRPDTISLKSIGTVWYSKYHNKVEFFTDCGINPENNKTLKPATEYILEKYAFTK